MKLLMIMVDSNHKKDVERILNAHDVPGYTELPNVLGTGKSGKKFGSRAFPGSNNLYFTAVGGNICQTLCAESAPAKQTATRGTHTQNLPLLRAQNRSFLI